MTDDVHIANDLPFEVEPTPHTWITLADDTRLAARLWRPATADSGPAILEYLPYRKADLVAGRDGPSQQTLSSSTRSMNLSSS